MKVKIKIAILAIIGFVSISFAQGHQFNITKNSPYFTHSVANQVSYIDFGDIRFWGHIEITLTGGYSHQNNVGKYTKRYEIGKNVGGGLYSTNETPSSFGQISSQWKLGDAFIDTNKHLKIPIYHLVSTGNGLTVNITGISAVNFDENLITFTTPTVVANNETRDYVTYKSQVNILDKLDIKSPKNRTLSLDFTGAQLGWKYTWQSFKTNSVEQWRIIGHENTNSSLSFRNATGKDILNLLQGGNVGIGTLTTGPHKLAVEGSIGAREIKVLAAPNWADFVFESNYNLPTLFEVENHIKEKGHLKDIPSAKDVKNNGFFLAEMDAKLLQKIEELTLYTIAQEKQLKIQKEKIKTLEAQTKEIKKLKELVKKLLENR
ncbi:hypothetical protein [Tenacibaculum aiptasiae]|uniref:hypothetical protein n=1 Tax=Tenacibaculum aiptasiae TaxID=426481 RepID=UPI0023304FAC|nr:hypothetical protein [Tenacibaculum aiptasiae]